MNERNQNVSVSRPPREQDFTAGQMRQMAADLEREAIPPREICGCEAIGCGICAAVRQYEQSAAMLRFAADQVDGSRETGEPGIERFDLKEVAARIVKMVVLSGMSVAELTAEKELRAMLRRVEADHHALLTQGRAFMRHTEHCESNICQRCTEQLDGHDDFETECAFKPSGCTCGLDRYLATVFGERT